jgi:hypothetical protein
MDDSLAVVTEASTEYVGQWNNLVSTTNWEKGRIISEWRQALQKAEADAGLVTDEAWSRQVGGVTPQHVGRLRRVFERFGQVHSQYQGLYWSHFQVALEWEDAEMWLEGAVQSRWSVARMCDQRWESQGAPAESQPKESDIVTSEVDEDVTEVNNALAATISDSETEVHGDSDAYFDGDSSAEDSNSWDDSASSEQAVQDEGMDSVASAAVADPVRPFESLPTMPADLQEAFDLFKLAILNHKVSSWQEIPRDDVLAVLDSLKQLAVAPTE